MGAALYLRRRLTNSSLVLLLLAASFTARGQEFQVEIANWTAAPFWSAGAESIVNPTAASGRTAQSRQALAGGGATPLPFIALLPCRLVDTRAPLFPAPLGGGFLPASTPRTYKLVGVCNLPTTAQAVSLNATVTNPTGPGFLTLWPADGPFPPVSTLNFLLGQTIVNAAVVPLSADGSITIISSSSPSSAIASPTSLAVRTRTVIP